MARQPGNQNIPALLVEDLAETLKLTRTTRKTVEENGHTPDLMIVGKETHGARGANALPIPLGLCGYLSDRFLIFVAWLRGGSRDRPGHSAQGNPGGPRDDCNGT